MSEPRIDNRSALSASRAFIQYSSRHNATITVSGDVGLVGGGTPANVAHCVEVFAPTTQLIVDVRRRTGTGHLGLADGAIRFRGQTPARRRGSASGVAPIPGVGSGVVPTSTLLAAVVKESAHLTTVCSESASALGLGHGER